MSGGGAPLPSWLASAQAAMDAVMGLRRLATKKDIHRVQRLVADFHNEARADWHAHNHIKSALVDFIMTQPSIASAVHAKQQQIYDYEAAKSRASDKLRQDA